MAHGAWSAEEYLAPPPLESSAPVAACQQPYHSGVAAPASNVGNPWAGASMSSWPAGSPVAAGTMYSAAPALPQQVPAGAWSHPVQGVTQQTSAGHAGASVQQVQPTMLTTLQPLAASVVAPAGANSGQQFSSPAASSSAPSAAEQPAAAQAAPPVPQVPAYRVWGEWVVTWQVQGEDHKGNLVWIDYDEKYQEDLETHYKMNPSGAFHAKPGQAVTFEYNTLKMYQRNMETNKMRLIRRCLVFKDEWLQMDARLKEHEQANTEQWNPKPSYDRRNSKGGGKGAWKGSRSRSSSQRR